ncbi:MAG: hypothetical protein KF726_11420 [Anaerolineae bacterium]|nr:hypothetical protein [Anaerolineae bacterium]
MAAILCLDLLITMAKSNVLNAADELERRELNQIVTDFARLKAELEDGIKYSPNFLS